MPGLTFCPTLNRNNAVVQDSASAWRYLACDADDTPPAVSARLIVDGVRHARTQANWPENAWFKGSFFSGDTQPADSTHEQAVQLDLLAIALRQSLDTLIQFFRLNPDMAAAPARHRQFPGRRPESARRIGRPCADHAGAATRQPCGGAARA